jgi:hypothetical protein
MPAPYFSSAASRSNYPVIKNYKLMYLLRTTLVGLVLMSVAGQTVVNIKYDFDETGHRGKTH